MNGYDREREARELEKAIHDIRYNEQGWPDVMTATTDAIVAALARAEAHGRVQMEQEARQIWKDLTHDERP